MGRPLKKDACRQALIQLLLEDEYTQHQVAKKVGLSQSMVSRYNPNRIIYERRKINEKEKQVICDLNKAGFNDEEIANILDRNSSVVRQNRAELNLSPVGHTCCSLKNRVSNPMLKKRIELCSEATQQFLSRYFRKLNDEGVSHG